MSTPVFETFWKVGNREICNPEEVARLVIEEGAIAVEVSAAQQADDYKLRQFLERWHREALKRHAEYVQDQQYRDSPEGRAAVARREAAENSGGIVTLSGPQDAATFELDQFSAQRTNRLKL